MDQRARKCSCSLCSENLPGTPISRLAVKIKIANQEIGVPGLLRFASDLDLPASIALLAFAAAAAGCARNSVPKFAGRAGNTFSRKHSYTVAYWTIPVACRITIEAQMRGHVAPPSVLAIVIAFHSHVKSRLD